MFDKCKFMVYYVDTKRNDYFPYNHNLRKRYSPMK